jgi:cell wall assembly regulator SMI1
VDTAERELGVTFPPDLKQYLARFGHIEVGHLEFFGLGDQIPDYLNLVRVTTIERTESGCPLPSDLVPLLNDGGGNLYCIAAGGSRSGQVLFWDHDAGPDQEPEVCASSLETWASELLTDLEEEP